MSLPFKAFSSFAAYFTGRAIFSVMRQKLCNRMLFMYILLAFTTGIYGAHYELSTPQSGPRVYSQSSRSSINRVNKRVADGQVFKVRETCLSECPNKVVRRLQEHFACPRIRYLKRVHLIESSCFRSGLFSRQVGKLMMASATKELSGYFENSRFSIPENEDTLNSSRVEYDLVQSFKKNSTLSHPDKTIRYSQRTDWNTWHLDRLDQYAGMNISCFPKRGKDVQLYVIDTGCRSTHNEFGSRITLRKTGSFTSASDDNGHGTHVAGLAAGLNSGVCKECNIVCYKALAADGGGSLADVMEAIDDIIERQENSRSPAVAVFSLGAEYAGTVLDDAITKLYEAGISPVVAAANFNRDACTSSLHLYYYLHEICQSSCSQLCGKSYWPFTKTTSCKFTPARAKGAISVGATNVMDSLWSQSNYGSCVDVMAPGEGITSSSFHGDWKIETRSGTSMSAPLVAGVIGLLLGESPDLKPDEIASLIKLNAKPITYTGSDGKTYATKMARVGQDHCTEYPFIFSPIPSVSPSSSPAPTPSSSPSPTPTSSPSPSPLPSPSPSPSLSASPSPRRSSSPSLRVRAVENYDLDSYEPRGSAEAVNPYYSEEDSYAGYSALQKYNPDEKFDSSASSSYQRATSNSVEITSAREKPSPAVSSQRKGNWEDYHVPAIVTLDPKTLPSSAGSTLNSANALSKPTPSPSILPFFGDAYAVYNDMFSGNDFNGRESDVSSISSDKACFPGDSIVELRGGAMKRMEEVHIGDSLLVSCNLYSLVFGFTHRLNNSQIVSKFVRLTIEGQEKPFIATSGHYVYLNEELKTIEEAQIGDVVTLGNGRHAHVIRVSTELHNGLFNFQTIHGDIVVNSVQASTYTKSVEASAAHAGLSIARVVYSWLGLQMVSFHDGSFLAWLLPYSSK